MLTIHNLTCEYSKYKNLFTGNLNDAYPEIEAALDLYGKDDEIDSVIDAFIEKCNSLINAGQAKKKPSSKKKEATAKPEKDTDNYDDEPVVEFIPHEEKESKKKKTPKSEDEIAEDLLLQMINSEVKSQINKILKKYFDKVSIEDSYYSGAPVLICRFSGKDINCDNLYVIPEISGRYTLSFNYFTKFLQTYVVDDMDLLDEVCEEFISKYKKPDEAKKPKPTKPKKQTKTELPVIDEVSIEFELIKSFVNLNGKVKTKAQIYNYVKKLQKAIVEKKIRKTSKYADEITYIQNFLIGFHNDMKSGTKTVAIPNYKLNQLNKIVKVKIADHIPIIKSYLNLLNKTITPTMDKAKTLQKKIAAGKFSDESKEVMRKIDISLEKYIKGKTDEPQINEYDLQGLLGLAGLYGLGNIPISKTTGFDTPIPATKLATMNFKTLDFTGKWLDLIGRPSEPFRIMFWGTGGGGKSTLVIDFIGYLARNFNKRILLVAKEEGISEELKDKFARMRAFSPNVFICPTIPARIMEYDCIFLDSVNTLNLNVENFEKLMNAYPQISWGLLFQTTKANNFLGEKQWQHLVYAEIKCEDGIATPLKNRYGGKKTIRIFLNQ